MKINTNNEAERDHLLQNGFSLDGVKYHCEEYRPQKEPFQYYRCQQFGHTTRECKDTKETCWKCGDGHRTAECNERDRKCANCQGSHPTTYPGCPAMKAANAAKLTQAMTYTQAARKSDELNALAVIEDVASCLSDHTGIECNLKETAKIVTASFNKLYKQNYDHTAITKFLTRKQ